MIKRFYTKASKKNQERRDRKRPIYETTPDSIDWSTAMGQQARALDAAARFAQKRSDPGMMVDIARQWQGFAETLMEASGAEIYEEDDDDDEGEDDSLAVGFRSQAKDNKEQV